MGFLPQPGGLWRKSDRFPKSTIYSQWKSVPASLSGSFSPKWGDSVTSSSQAARDGPHSSSTQPAWDLWDSGKAAPNPVGMSDTYIR